MGTPVRAGTQVVHSPAYQCEAGDAVKQWAVAIEKCQLVPTVRAVGFFLLPGRLLPVRINSSVHIQYVDRAGRVHRLPKAFQKKAGNNRFFSPEQKLSGTQNLYR